MRLFSADPPTSAIYTLSLHDALPISRRRTPGAAARPSAGADRGLPGVGRALLHLPGVLPRPVPRPVDRAATRGRSEEHTSELQSRFDLVCRLLLEKKKINIIIQFL